MKNRFLSSCVMIPLPLLAAYYGHPYWQITAILIAWLMAWEWERIVTSKTDIFSTAILLCVAFTSFFVHEYGRIWVGIPVMILFSVFVYIKAKHKEIAHPKILTLGVPYVTIGVEAIVLLQEAFGPSMIYWLFAIVWGMDIGGYIFGCTIGGPKLAPKISPKKTWAGLIGGMISAGVLSVVFFSFTMKEPMDAKDIVYIVIFSSIMAFVSQIGDLFESGIKRKFDVKDSSNLIPGHGGILDRVDGLVFAAPVFLLSLKLFIKYIF